MLSQVAPFRLIKAFVFPSPLETEAHIGGTNTQCPPSELYAHVSPMSMIFASSRRVFTKNCEIKLDLKGILESFLECFIKYFGGDIIETITLYYVCIALFNRKL